MGYIDQAWQRSSGEEGDFKMRHTIQELVSLLGNATVGKLLGYFGRIQPIAPWVEIRRSSRHGDVLAFHTDHSVIHPGEHCESDRTLGVMLNSDYDGARLVFVNATGFHYVHRSAGTATLHPGDIAHGVTA